MYSYITIKLYIYNIIKGGSPHIVSKKLSLYNQRNKYKIKKDEEDNEYISTELTTKEEIVEDLKQIQEMLGNEFLYVNVRRENLNQHLRKLNFTITK